MGINAQTSVPKFTIGDVLTAANTNLLTNAPPVFSGTATRDAAFGGAGEKTLAEGQLCYLEDSNVVQYYDGAAWASVSSTAPTSRIRLHTHNGYGSSSTKIPRFATTVVNSGSDITYADSASLGSTFTINTAGMYAVSFGSYSAANAPIISGLSLNSTQLSSAIWQITAADRLAQQHISTTDANGSMALVSIVFYFAVSDVIRPHNEGNVPVSGTFNFFNIARVN